MNPTAFYIIEIISLQIRGIRFSWRNTINLNFLSLITKVMSESFLHQITYLFDGVVDIEIETFLIEQFPKNVGQNRNKTDNRLMKINWF